MMGRFTHGSPRSEFALRKEGHGGALIAIAFALSTSGSAMAAGPEGTLRSESGETKVRIAPCGADHCGTIVWAQDDGADIMNPDPAKRAALLVGTQMITGMRPSAGGFSGRL